MGAMGGFDFSGMEELQKQLRKLEESESAFVQGCTKELAARLLAKVKKRTPVGQYDKPVKFTTGDGQEVSFQPHTGKKGGTLRRGWTSGNLNHFGDTYVIEIENPVEYASYVEFGHRLASRKDKDSAQGQGWVQGRFMMTRSEKEIRRIAPKVLESRIRKHLGGCLK